MEAGTGSELVDSRTGPYSYSAGSDPPPKCHIRNECLVGFEQYKRDFQTDYKIMFQTLLPVTVMAFQNR